MNIQEFLLELYAEELSDMFAGNRNALAESRPKLLPLMNSVMRQAYAKWKCAYDSEMLTTTEDVTDYTLAATDVLQVTQLVNVYGQDVPSNEYQVLGKQIYFPFPQNATYEVVYKVTHTNYTVAQDDTAVTLVLPDLLVPWLKAMVCHRYFASMKTEGALLKAADFLAQAQLAEHVFVSTNTTGEFTAPTNTKLEARGFA